MDHPEVTCEEFREDLPLRLAAGEGLPMEMEGHRVGCEPCRGEEEMVRALFALRPAPPTGLAGQISAALRAAPPAPVPSVAGGSWGVGLRFLLPVAALLVAVLGTVLVRGGGSMATGDSGPAIAASAGISGGMDGAHLWPSANGMVAGEPLLLLEGLSEEQLEALLEEMEG